MTVYIKSKRRFPTNSPTEIQWLHPLKSIHYDTIPQNYRGTNQLLTYYFFFQHGCIKPETVYDSHNFRLRSQSKPHNYTGNNVPAHQLRQSTESTSFAYANDTGDDTYNLTFKSQHHWENQQHPTMPPSGTDHNHLPPEHFTGIDTINCIIDCRSLNFILFNQKYLTM